jgi:hypothetical protein
VGADFLGFTFTVPDGWAGIGLDAIWVEENKPPGGASMLFTLGNWLYSDPCRKPDTASPDVRVGPTADDFAGALANHPLLDVTAPVDVTLAGYSGKYVDLQVPTDISACDVYRVWDPSIYAQGPGHRWHLWILDVNGIRVVVESTDYAGTSPQHRAELQAIVNSLRIEP